ncbi:MAG: DUF1540 domain-containing protein [Dehalococcoidales bacterium]|nr:DUF1540 domain-containing protein [Dehalococcoidales bacterium]
MTTRGMEMTRIAGCNVTKCIYNMNNECHTLAINVGTHAECNTFYGSESNKSGFNEVRGGIGACLASDCKYNDKLECKAPNVNITAHNIHADCKTFTPR